MATLMTSSIDPITHFQQKKITRYAATSVSEIPVKESLPKIVSFAAL